MPSHNRRRILVVNPNSNEHVTRGLAAALAPVMFQEGPEIVCEASTPCWSSTDWKYSPSLNSIE